MAGIEQHEANVVVHRAEQQFKRGDAHRFYGSGIVLEHQFGIAGAVAVEMNDVRPDLIERLEQVQRANGLAASMHEMMNWLVRTRSRELDAISAPSISLRNSAPLP
jgi:hypothetical protein